MEVMDSEKLALQRQKEKDQQTVSASFICTVPYINNTKLGAVCSIKYLLY